MFPKDQVTPWGVYGWAAEPSITVSWPLALWWLCPPPCPPHWKNQVPSVQHLFTIWAGAQGWECGGEEASLSQADKYV